VTTVGRARRTGPRPRHDAPLRRTTGRIITLLTDFGGRDAYVGIMKGVALGICPTATLVDLTHELPAQAVRAGALLLRSSVEYFPDGTVHLAVVDPGVGSARAAIVVTTPRAFLVGPDNGLLAPAAARLGVRSVHRLSNESFFRSPVSATFHGRDVFAPVAAHLAAGTPPEAFGDALATLEPLDLPEPVIEPADIRGEVLYVDRFGNLVTNIPAEALSAFRGSEVFVRIAAMSPLSLTHTYADAAPGAPLAVIGSWSMLEIAVRDGSAAEHFGAGIGTPVTVAGR